MKNLNRLSSTDIQRYHFDQNQLKNGFLINANREVDDSKMIHKMYQLYNFRLQYSKMLPIDDLLFYFYRPKSYTNFTRIVKTIKQLQFTQESFKLSDFLNDSLFKNIPFIRDYFCYSTFPSLFSSFVSEESYKDGYDFIKKNFDDIDILPFLISSYLKHSLLFQDRFISTFFQKVVALISENDDTFSINSSQKVDIFNETFQACLSYLNQYQIKVIQDLNEKDHELAKFCISELFLKDFLEIVANYHSWTINFPILNLETSIRNPPNSSFIHHSTIFQGLYQLLDFEVIMNYIKNCETFFEFASIQEFICDGGSRMVLSIADLKLLELLALYNDRKQNPENTVILPIGGRLSPREKQNFLQINKYPLKEFQLDSFTKDVFSIVHFYREYFDRQSPVPTPTTTKDANKRTQESREFYQYLLSHSGHATKLHIYRKSAYRISDCHLRQYISNLFSSEIHNLSEYIDSQIIRYITSEYHFFCNNESINVKRTIMPKVRSKIDNSNDHVLINSKLSQIIMSSVIDEVAKVSKNIKYQPDLPYVYNLTRFLDHLSDVAYHIWINNCNHYNCSFKLPVEFNLDQKTGQSQSEFDQYVQQFVQNNTKEIAEQDIEKHFLDELNFFDSYSELRLIISQIDQALQFESANLRSNFNMGNKIQMFLEIYDMIEVSIKKSYLQDEPELLQCLLIKIFLSLDSHPVDCSDINTFNKEMLLFFRAHLIRARLFIKNAIKNTDEHSIIERNMLSHTLSKIDKLSFYCNLNETIFPNL